MAEHPILEAMARGVSDGGLEWLRSQGDGDLGWADVPDSVLALAVLRSLAEAEPTDAMVDAGLSVHDGGLDDEANRHYSRKEFSAMLRALIEEVEAAHG